MNQIIMLAASLDQPRIVKRIIEKSFVYDRVIVYGFRRDKYNVDNFSKIKEYSNVEINIVGNLKDGKYLSRLFLYLKLYLIISVKFLNRSKNIYAFGQDLSILANFFINKKIQYEISDILWLYKSNFQKKILRKIDYFIAKRSNKVYFTSEGFYVKYYNFLSLDKIEIIENKFKSFGRVFPIENIKTDKIRVAYIGSFRYKDIIRNLMNITSSNTDVILSFYGDGPSDIVNEIKNKTKNSNQINYSGAFRNPDDLEQIYAENNINFVVYDNSLENERVALPNKYYESGYFNIPILCASNTFLSEKVEEHRMGWNINPDAESITSFFANLKIQQLYETHNTIKSIDKSIFSI